MNIGSSTDPNDIPIFDCLTHPTLNGNWLSPKDAGRNFISDLENDMSSNNIRWALAIGMGKDIGGYEHIGYANMVKNSSSKIFPVAYCDIHSLKHKSEMQLGSFFRELVALGYVGIKLHPRFGEFCFNDPFLVNISQHARSNSLVVMLCTYCWECSPRIINNTLSNLGFFLEQVSDVPVVLVHAGGVKLLEYIELARAFSNVLLDLSMTLCKYAGSSIDLDLEFAFRQFDRRICIGSDGPEYKGIDIRSRFNLLGEGVECDKLKNIAYRNIFSFFPLIGELS